MTTWEARERLAFRGGKACLLETNDIVVFNKVVEGPGNFLATVGGSNIRLVKGKTVNVVRNNVRDTGGGGRKGGFGGWAPPPRNEGGGLRERGGEGK